MSDALFQSLILTLVGMVVIFIFMGALIIIVHYFVAFAAKFFPDKNEEEEGPKDKPEDSDKAVVAAIAAAIHGKTQGKK